jgi:hypothetical protein
MFLRLGSHVSFFSLRANSLQRIFSANPPAKRISLERHFMQKIASVLVLLVCCLFVGVNTLSAQRQATINHGVNLRGDPSSQNPPIEHLSRSATVTLLAKRPRAGYYHVQTADGIKGWVVARYLTVEEQTVKQPTTNTRSAPTTTVAGSTSCDKSLWDHVYNPQRLLVKQKCVTVTGTIVDATHGRRRDGVRREADGDTHGWLRLDPKFENLLSAGNISNEAGNLVFEIVCEFPVRQADAITACEAYNNSVKLPPVGSRVRITGSYVQDNNHARWVEIHPVSSIQVIP